MNLTIKYKAYIHGTKCIYQDVLHWVIEICQICALCTLKIAAFKKNAHFLWKNTHFIEKHTWPTYKKTQPLISPFIKKLFFQKNRDPWIWVNFLRFWCPPLLGNNADGIEHRFNVFSFKLVQSLLQRFSLSETCHLIWCMLLSFRHSSGWKRF